MKREVVFAVWTGVASTAVLALLIIAGSRRLSHFDAALVGYTFASMFAVFGIAYRYALWLQRPPTAVYWKRGWQAFLAPSQFPRNLLILAKRFFGAFALNNFIWRRSIARGAAHWLILWGCVVAAAITFPLVFGWIHFDVVSNDFDHYRVMVFGFPTMTFAVHSLLGHVIFHGLVWASFLVIGGVMLAMRRRMRDRDAAALQQFAEDLLPLILLFAVSVTGLMLVVSYEWMRGYGYEFLSILHAAVVILTLVWLPFGKFFHIFQRPAQLGVSFYKDAGARSKQALCGRCGAPFASEMQVEDLIEVQRRLGYRYEIQDGPVEHYQRICPRCRRLLPAIAQGRLWGLERSPTR